MGFFFPPVVLPAALPDNRHQNAATLASFSLIRSGGGGGVKSPVRPRLKCGSLFPDGFLQTAPAGRSRSAFPALHRLKCAASSQFGRIQRLHAPVLEEDFWTLFRLQWRVCRTAVGIKAAGLQPAARRVTAATRLFGGRNPSGERRRRRLRFCPALSPFSSSRPALWEHPGPVRKLKRPDANALAPPAAAAAAARHA